MTRIPIILLLVFASVSATVGQTLSPSPHIFAPKPRYPDAWAKKGITGKGVAILTVDHDTGYVTEAHMLESTGQKLLDDSALEAFRKWHFKPGTVSPVRVPIEFNTKPIRTPKT
jgi:TonB family protein